MRPLAFLDVQQAFCLFTKFLIFAKHLGQQLISLQLGSVVVCKFHIPSWAASTCIHFFLCLVFGTCPAKHSHIFRLQAEILPKRTASVLLEKAKEPLSGQVKRTKPLTQGLQQKKQGRFSQIANRWDGKGHDVIVPSSMRNKAWTCEPQYFDQPMCLILMVNLCQAQWNCIESCPLNDQYPWCTCACTKLLRGTNQASTSQGDPSQLGRRIKHKWSDSQNASWQHQRMQM